MEVKDSKWQWQRWIFFVLRWVRLLLIFARHALDEALERVKSRKMFGAPMSSLQLIQAKLGDMSLDIDASALLIYRAAWTKDMGADRITREAAMAK